MFTNIQILRAFAAFCVVFVHIIVTGKSYGFEAQLMYFFVDWGSFGVDLFFVISGFIIITTQMENKRNISAFLKYRLIRIIPLYWLITLIIIFIYLIFPSVFREMKITQDWALSSLSFVSKIVLEKNPIVYVGWTLELEILFYIVFGLSLWFRSLLISILITVVVLILTASLVLNFIILEIVGGMAIAVAYKKYGIVNFGGSSLVLGFLLLLSSLAIEIREAIIYREIMWGIPSMLVVYGAITVKQVKSKLGKLLGDASYSIYLMQMLVIPVFYKLTSKINTQVNTDFLTIACFLLTAIVGTYVFLIIEKPLIHYLKNLIIK